MYALRAAFYLCPERTDVMFHVTFQGEKSRTHCIGSGSLLPLPRSTGKPADCSTGVR